MFKYTSTTLHKMEDILKESGYLVRYEKGSFKPGYCILESKKVVVVNKYYGMEARINSLMEIIPLLQIDPAFLSDKLQPLFRSIHAKNATV